MKSKICWIFIGKNSKKIKNFFLHSCNFFVLKNFDFLNEINEEQVNFLKEKLYLYDYVIFIHKYTKNVSNFFISESLSYIDNLNADYSIAPICIKKQNQNFFLANSLLHCTFEKHKTHDFSKINNIYKNDFNIFCIFNKVFSVPYFLNIIEKCWHSKKPILEDLIFSSKKVYISIDNFVMFDHLILKDNFIKININNSHFNELIKSSSQIFQKESLFEYIFRNKIIYLDWKNIVIESNFINQLDFLELVSLKINEKLPNIDYFDYKNIFLAYFNKNKTLNQIIKNIYIDFPYLNEMNIDINKIHKNVFNDHYFLSDIFYEIKNACKLLAKKMFVIFDNEINYFNFDDFYEKISKIKNINISNIFYKNKSLFISNFKKWEFKFSKTFILKSNMETLNFFQDDGLFKYLNKFYAPGYKEFLSKFQLRIIYKIIANKLYSNPFLFKVEDSNFNKNPYIIGYFIVGPFLFAICKDILNEIQKNNFKKIVFNYRDGYLFHEAFKLFKNRTKLNIKIEDSWISRSSLIVFLFANKETLYSLPFYFWNKDINLNYFLSITKNFLYNNLIFELESIKKEKINSIQLTKLLLKHEKFIDYTKFPFSKYRDFFFEKFSKHNTLFFEMGYSGRISSILKTSIGLNLNEYNWYYNSQKIIPRFIKNNINIKSFYNFKPSKTFNDIREIIFSSSKNSCISVKYNNNKFVNVYANKKNNKIQELIISILQKASLDFVKDIFDKFQRDWNIFCFDEMDFCYPLEYYINHSKIKDREIFNMVNYDNDFDSLNKDDSDFLNNWINFFKPNSV